MIELQFKLRPISHWFRSDTLHRGINYSTTLLTSNHHVCNTLWISRIIIINYDLAEYQLISLVFESSIHKHGIIEKQLIIGQK